MNAKLCLIYIVQVGFFGCEKIELTTKIVPDKSAPIMGAEFQVKEVTLDPVSITRQDLFFDTGIR